jgi:hypothetical protein
MHSCVIHDNGNKAEGMCKENIDGKLDEPDAVVASVYLI